MKRIYVLIMTVLIGAILVSCKKAEMVLVEESEESEEFQSEDQEKTTKAGQDIAYCYVYLCGEVNVPGVYAVPEGTRLYEVLELAGGFSLTADQTRINIAICVTDGQQVYIPSIEETKQQDAEAGINSEGKVNINYATQEELCTLPGIGEARACEIITYREENGAFKSVEEIKLVSGIKDGLYQKIKGYIVV